jgi:hypothetical protein
MRESKARDKKNKDKKEKIRGLLVEAEIIFDKYKELVNESLNLEAIDRMIYQQTSIKLYSFYNKFMGQIKEEMKGV